MQLIAEMGPCNLQTVIQFSMAGNMSSPMANQPSLE